MDPSEKLRLLLTERRLDQKEVAGVAGIAYNTFRSYLKKEGASLPTADTGVKIARFLGVSTEWLWSDAPWPPPNEAKPGHSEALRLSCSLLLERLEHRATNSAGQEIALRQALITPAAKRTPDQADRIVRAMNVVGHDRYIYVQILRMLVCVGEPTRGLDEVLREYFGLPKHVVPGDELEVSKRVLKWWDAMAAETNSPVFTNAPETLPIDEAAIAGNKKRAGRPKRHRRGDIMNPPLRNGESPPESLP